MPINPYLSMVNQKLFFCNMLLEQGLEKKIPADMKPAYQLEIALCQSALYQMESAYLNYLREIAHTYQCKQIELISSIKGLIAALNSIEKMPDEANEIASLTEDPLSWLSRLLFAYKALPLPSAVRGVTDRRQQSSSLLEVRQLDESVCLDYQLLQDWKKYFIEMVERHRELMCEF